jgi:hypothetical protein
MLVPAAAACGSRALSRYNTVVRFFNQKGYLICRFKQGQYMWLSSTADPLPTGFLARRIRLSAGTAKRAQSIDISRIFGVEGAIFEG